MKVWQGEFPLEFTNLVSLCRYSDFKLVVTICFLLPAGCWWTCTYCTKSGELQQFILYSRVPQSHRKSHMQGYSTILRFACRRYHHDAIYLAGLSGARTQPQVLWWFASCSWAVIWDGDVRFGANHTDRVPQWSLLPLWCSFCFCYHYPLQKWSGITKVSSV